MIFLNSLKQKLMNIVNKIKDFKDYIKKWFNKEK